ncbi:PREDICTED: peptide chain release factor 1-like, mitochondrial [Nicrophorus vespilloides]|uniref:Peptide chain release factor 1-like, mitochondrial n=1 Tax=Nicrophorus vespilloides TaxID=110193 RepID=A0ABM1M5N4_NICVS|nr:PREDICTED: peptide chain release factor 1-like, mitochondrial [Nicrophorus vespilloides]
MFVIKYASSIMCRAQNVRLLRPCSYAIDLKIGDYSMSKYIEKLVKEYECGDTQNVRKQELKPIMSVLDRRKEVIKNIESLKELLSDPDESIKKLAEEEQFGYDQKILELDEHLKEVLLPADNEDNVNAIVLDVSSGVGGQEAMLFANEVFEMYKGYIEFKGWQCEIAEFMNTDIGGLRHASLLVEGENAYKCFKYEAGVHRVQRIPSTEKSGRIHTSTISVNVLPQPTDIQIDLQAKDLRIETKRASGAGGQHVNTTDSAVRIVHIPTNVAIECQTDRSQIKNRQFAMQRLRAKLYEMQLEEQLAKTQGLRKSQVRTKFRNEKIRTYNFGQDRITDHRVAGNVHNMKVFMLGGAPLDDLIDKLDHQTKLERLRELLDGHK